MQHTGLQDEGFRLQRKKECINQSMTLTGALVIGTYASHGGPQMLASATTSQTGCLSQQHSFTIHCFVCLEICLFSI
jgi:hypothetical protein